MEASATARRPFALAMVVALTLSAFALAGVTQADADDFTTGTSAPSIVITDYSRTIQPASQNSVATYFVTVEVADADGVTTIEEVEVCLFNSDTRVGGSAKGDCGEDDADPRTTLHLLWVADELEDEETFAADDDGVTGFSLTGDNFHTLGVGDDVSTWATTGGSTPGLLTLTFRFKVSEALLAGIDWSLEATVRDNTPGTPRTASDQAGFDDESVVGATGAIDVLYFSAIQTVREQLDYGVVDAGQESSAKTGLLGAFRSNDKADLTLDGDDFKYTAGDFTATLSLVTFDPGLEQVSVRCEQADTLSGTRSAPGSSIFVDVNPGLFATDRFAAVTRTIGEIDGVGDSGTSYTNRGTGEGTVSLNNICALAYGGGAEVSSQKYSADIVVGIGRAAGGP